MNKIGGSAFANPISQLHNKVLSGSYILQVDEVVCVSEPQHDQEDKEEEHSSSENRVLKLHMTDGTQSLVGFEYKRIPQFLKILPGQKVKIENT